MSGEPVAIGRPMILVLGMHRSGTSAVAGTLSHLGVDFSERLIEASPDNPKGYFEHADVWRQDHDILQALGSAWDDPLPLPEGWQQSDAVRQAEAPIRAILERDFGGSGPLGVKDPRMCRLVPPWRKLLAREGFSARAVLVVRRPEEVIASLARRDHLPADQAAWVWLRHVIEAEAATRGMPRVLVRYEQLLKDWRTQAARMARALDIAWPREPGTVGADIDAFLEPALRHYRAGTGAGLAVGPLNGWLERTYAAITVGDGEDTAALDDIAAEIARADQTGAANAAVLRATRRLSLQFQDTLTWSETERQGLVAGSAQLRENLDRHARELAAAKAGNAQLRENLDRHARELAATKAGNAQLQENLDRHVDELAAMRKGNAQLRENLERHIAALDQMKHTNTRLQENVERHAVRLSEISRELAGVVAERDLLLGQRDRLADELSRVYASRSWRITRPMRGAVRMGGRMLRPPAPVPAALAPVEPPVPVMPVAAPIDDPAAALEAAFAAATGPRILIVTPDILGPIRNGGIGTAFHALAVTLAQAGRAVTILYTLGQHNEDGAGIARWEAYYARQGIRFIPATLEHGEPRLDAPHHCWRAYRVYLWMKAHQAQFDIAYFPEWKGESYYASQAKRLGLGFASLTIAVVTHSSTTWAESGNYVLPRQFDDLVLEYLERRSTEMADVVISPSQYMFDWMAQRGWQINAPTHVIQNLMPAEAIADEHAEPGAFAVTEWVFFGRLERRKGLHIFLDALRRVPPKLRERVRVTFLGKAVQTADFDSFALIAEKTADWPQPPQILTDRDRDQALDYLRQPGRVAVIASLVENSPYTVLECVLARIPFVAADVGGIAELVHPQDRERALFKPTPTGLAQTLVQLESGRYSPPRPAQPATATRDRWLALQDELAAAAKAGAEAEAPSADGPHISVCLVHYDRPHLLAQALDSLRQQTYRHFDVVLVDDGSPSPEAKQYLDGLREEFAWRGWTLHRQANAYLGAARNAAVRLARGEYVLFMDDDNLAKPDELAVFAHAAAHSGADILTTVSDVFRDDENAGRPPARSRELWIPLGNAAGLGVFRNVFGDANALVRRSLFERLGGFTEDYGVGHEDWEFFARATLAGADLQLVPEPLFWYRVGEASMLRAGQAQTDHARSVRPYWEGLHEGVGPALAFALHLQRQPPSGIPSADAAPARSRLARLAHAVLSGQAHRRFLHLLRTEGVRVAAARALHYSGLRRR
ncbi:glycosyltransferase [Frateuria sp. GZRR33]|uniref:glycosyltransferase n=1 Tax=Frateuria sp. GZRR33 TaxID=3351535 RepID=UPI003EDBB148